VWRLVAAGLLLALLLAVYLGLFVLGLGDAQERPLLFMVFWMSCMALAIVLMFVAAADMRDVERLRDSHEAELWRDFARTLAARQRKEDRSNAKPPPQQR
jgi:Zn-dependent protease with chaperone function